MLSPPPGVVNAPRELPKLLHNPFQHQQVPGPRKFAGTAVAVANFCVFANAEIFCAACSTPARHAVVGSVEDSLLQFYNLQLFMHGVEKYASERWVTLGTG